MDSAAHRKTVVALDFEEAGVPWDVRSSALALIVSDSFCRDVVQAGSAAAVTAFPGRESPGPALVEALLSVPCVRGAEGRRLPLNAIRLLGPESPQATALIESG